MFLKFYKKSASMDVYRYQHYYMVMLFYSDWQPIVKYSTRSYSYNGLNIAEFFDTDDYNVYFPDDNCGIDPSEKCNRPYKHTLQKELMGNDKVKQVSIE